jgi:hypothetical protein
MEDAHGDVFDDLPEAVRSEWDQLVRTVAQLREVRNALNAYNDKITASIEKNAILLVCLPFAKLLILSDYFSCSRTSLVKLSFDETCLHICLE